MRKHKEDSPLKPALVLVAALLLAACASGVDSNGTDVDSDAVGSSGDTVFEISFDGAADVVDSTVDEPNPPDLAVDTEDVPEELGPDRDLSTVEMVQEEVGPGDLHDEELAADVFSEPDLPPPPLTIGPVGPAFTNAPNWNDYVVAGDIFESTLSACNPSVVPEGYFQCQHGGEARVALISGADSCAGIDISDNRDALEWHCIEAAGDQIFAVSTRLHDDVRLIDLIDTTGPAFVPMSVHVTDGDRADDTAETVWWNNDIIILTGQDYRTLENTDPTDTIGTIFVGDLGGGVGGSMWFGDDKIALLTTGTGNFINEHSPLSEAVLIDAHRFTWVEGSYLLQGEYHTALTLRNAYLNVIRHVELAYSNTGIQLEGTDATHSNHFSHMKIWSFGSQGLNLTTAARHNHFFGVYIANIGTSTTGGTGIQQEGPSDNVSGNHFSHITMASMGYGIDITGTSNDTFDTITVMNTESELLLARGTASLVLMGATMLNADDENTDMTGGRATLDGLILAGQYWTTLLFDNSGDPTTLIRDVAAVNVGNDTDGYDLNAPACTTDDCGIALSGHHYVGGCGGNAFEPTTVGVPECDPWAETNYTRLIYATVEDWDFFGNELVLRLTSDDVTNEEESHTIAGQDIVKWVNFDSPWRGWGPQEVSEDWPDYGLVGSCDNTSSSPCIIWDARLKSSATVLRNVFSVVATDVAVHTWTAPQSGSQAQCDSYVAGSIHNSSFNVCETHYLVRAIEIANDRVGNDNSLCEANEACLERANYGSYQGEGPLVFVTEVDGGPIPGVQLFRYQYNGVTDE